MIFWNEDTPPELAEKYAKDANERWRIANGRATWNLLQMAETPLCEECRRHHSVAKWYGKALCSVCVPEDVEPIPPTEPVVHPIPQATCAWVGCGKVFKNYRGGRQRVFCSARCQNADMQSKNAQTFAHRAGVPYKTRKRAEEYWPYYWSGETYEQIGKRFGVGRETVRRTLTQSHYPVKRHRDAKPIEQNSDQSPRRRRAVVADDQKD